MAAKKEQQEAGKVTVEAAANSKRVWRHKGELMKAGATAEVTEAQAARLKERGLIK